MLKSLSQIKCELKSFLNLFCTSKNQSISNHSKNVIERSIIKPFDSTTKSLKIMIKSLPNSGEIFFSVACNCIYLHIYFPLNRKNQRLLILSCFWASDLVNLGLYLAD